MKSGKRWPLGLGFKVKRIGFRVKGYYRDITQIAEKKMEQNMEHEMERPTMAADRVLLGRHVISCYETRVPAGAW